MLRLYQMVAAGRMPSQFPLYESYREQMKTGDLITFSGKNLGAKLIKLVTRSPYSHIGMVLNMKMGGGFGQSVLLVESHNSLETPDVKTNIIIRGVQMQWLSDRLNFHRGAAWWVPLQKPLSTNSLEKMQEWLRQTHRAPYDYSQLVGVGFDLLDQLGLENPQDLSSLFCSELVTKALQIAGVVPEEINPSEQTPKDVVKFDCFVEPILIKQDEKDR